MSVPGYLSSTYYYSRLKGVTDVAEILAELAILMATAGWTSELSSMVSPTDVYGRKFYATPSAGGTTRITLNVCDQNHDTVGARIMDISSVNKNTVQIFIGSHHICIDNTTPAHTYGEWVAAGILDVYPNLGQDCDNYVFVQGSRNSAGTLSYVYWSYATMLDNAVSRHDDRSNSKNRWGHDAPYQMPGAIEIFYPQEMAVQPLGEPYYEDMWYAGRAYQRIIIPHNLVDKQSEVKIPIDTGTFGTFRGVAGAYKEVYGEMRLAMRAA